ncbi:hypothetical protein [Paenibacillus sp. FSL M7-0896]|uniref:hypothetical protein n=1 Tax=Paenibacillus sp. FSL M7-0896 TaxID=2921610 RepID=UPI0030DB0B8F
MARPSKYKEEFAQQAYKLCLLGATDKELANFFEVDEATINRWKLSNEEFCEALKSGKFIADSNVAEKLYQRAIGYQHVETITASYQGQITDTLDVTKYYAPDPTSAIFWLKNRQPKLWRDKPDSEERVKKLIALLTGLNMSKEEIDELMEELK